MTDVAVNERRRWSMWRVALWLAACALVLGAAGAVGWHFLFMPWLVRQQFMAVLNEAGLEQVEFRVTHATVASSEIRDLTFAGGGEVERINVTYSVGSLRDREVVAIRIVGATLPLNARLAPVSEGDAPTTGPARGAIDLPFELLSVRDSHLLMPGGERLAFEGAIRARGREIEVTLEVADQLNAAGVIADSMEAGEVRVTATEMQGQVLSEAAGLMMQLPVELRGTVSGVVTAKWEAAGGEVVADLTVAGGTNEPGEAKLSVAGGVFQVTADLGSTTRPSATIAIRDADLATPDLVATGVTGEVSLVSLSPPVSAGQQRLTAEKLTVGELEFANGEMEFSLNGGGDMTIAQTRWDWLGGAVSASDVQIPREGPVTLTLHARHVELGQLLNKFAQDKASGEGKISGDLPVKLDGSKIEFGDAQLSSRAGGGVQIKDVATIAATAEAAAQAEKDPSAGAQIKRNIIEALADFEYEHLSASLRNEGDGLTAHVNMRGRGRTGARQPIDYELNVRNLDQLLRSYLNIRSALSGPATGKAAS